MKTFTLIFIVTVCAVTFVTCQNPEGLPDGGMKNVDDEMRKIRRDTSDFQKELEEKIEKMKENVQAVKERLMEEYEKLKKMLNGAVDNMQEKGSMEPVGEYHER